MKCNYFLLLLLGFFIFTTSAHAYGTKYKELLGLTCQQLHIIDKGYSTAFKSKMIEIYTQFKGVKFITIEELEKEKFSNPKSKMVYLDVDISNTVTDGNSYKSTSQIEINQIDGGFLGFPLPSWTVIKVFKDKELFYQKLDESKTRFESGILQSSKVLNAAITYALENKVKLHYYKWIGASAEKYGESLKNNENTVFYDRDIHREGLGKEVISSLNVIYDDEYKALMLSNEDKIVSFIFNEFGTNGKIKLLVNNETGVVIYFDVKDTFYSFHDKALDNFLEKVK